MTVTVKHNKTNAISDWTQAQLDEQIALGNFAEGTVLADIVLPSDWNDDHTLTGLGTMAEQNANSVAITGGSVNGTTIGATTASTGRFTSVTTPSVTATTTDLTLSAISTGKINLNTATANQVQITDATAANGQYTLLSRDNTANEQRISGATTTGGVNFGISSAVAGSVKFYTNGFTELQAQVARTASAVNYVQVTGAATGGIPNISAQGSDASIPIILQSKSTSPIILQNGLAQRQLRVDGTGTGVNYFNIVSSATAQAPIFSIASASSDTNVSMAFQPKGTGAINLAAGSSGVNISNGGTVTAITRTVQGSGYTSVPSLAISAPTTAGGVQATATANLGVLSATIVSGGTGYAVGNTLTVVGGTGTAAQLTVSTVSSGVITAVTIAAQNGVYSVFPTSPVSVTGGAGSGATFNISGGILSTFTITAAGSGYIEQPTITFSGGGGSGAAAYATVGGNQTIKGIGVTAGASITFSTPAGDVLKIADAGATTTNFLYAGTGVTPFITSQGTNAALALSSNGSGTLWLRTNGAGTNQMAITHTASAVNYVQVTGAATANPPVISSQGSDSTIAMIFQAKGGQDHRFFSNSGSAEQFRVIHTAGTIVNQTTATGSATGVAPSFSVRGTDTNIDLALTPKGTGVVQFGTHTANADVAISGFITIRDAGGTLRKLAVIT